MRSGNAVPPLKAWTGAGELMKTILALLWLTGLQAHVQAPVPCPPAPLTEAQVLQLVKDRVPEARIVQFVDACHIAWVTPEVLGRLRDGGATDAVLAAVRSQRQLTFEQARQEIVTLEKKIAEVQEQRRLIRDQRLAQVGADYRRGLKKLGTVGPKDRYEAAAEY